MKTKKYVLANEKEVGCENDNIYILEFGEDTEHSRVGWKSCFLDDRFHDTYHKSLRAAKAHVRNECALRGKTPRFKWKLK